MAITNIRRDWGVGPSIVRITTTDNLAAITTAGYLTAQEDEIRALNNGDFAWIDTDYVLISYNGGIGFFLRDAVNATFVAAAVVPGTLADTLPSGEIFVGNAGNVATAVAKTGDVAIDNAGATTIQAGAIDLAMLSAGITPSHVIKFADQHTTVGGAAAEPINIPGVLVTDLAFVQLVDDGTNNVTVSIAVCTADTLTVTFSADPGNDAIINYQIIRAAA